MNDILAPFRLVTAVVCQLGCLLQSLVHSAGAGPL